MFYAVDTDNHEIISFDSLESGDASISRYAKIKQIPVGNRPHDILFDKYIYVLLNHGILKFSPTKDSVKDVTFYSKNEIAKIIQSTYPEFSIGYMRSFTIVDGTIYLVNSSYGNIIEIGDFLNPATWKLHTNKNQPKRYSEKGNFDSDNLILNDVEFYKGYWYASNYYPGADSNFRSDSSVSKNKLIRWQSWDDFKNSNWEDLSNLVHPESIPYNFTKYDERLFLAMFHSGNDEGLGSGIYEIKTSFF